MSNQKKDNTNMDLIIEFTEERIKSRYETVGKLLQDFIEKEKIGDLVQISFPILDHAILDYFRDIYRIKDFNKEIEYVNQTKITAYLAYWICRRKPIQITQSLDSEEAYKKNNIQIDDLVFINEKFACSFIQNFLFQNPSDVAILDEDEEVYNEFLINLLYVFKYRQFTAQNIESIILAFNGGRKYQHSADL